jgi:hypothetical protein
MIKFINKFDNFYNEVNILTLIILNYYLSYFLSEYIQLTYFIIKITLIK